MASAAIVVGNPKPKSRTLTVAEEVMSQLAACLVADTLASDTLAGDPRSAPLLVDLAEHAGSIFDWGDATLQALTAEVAQCRLLVAASPTYKATYTGLLKSFFDRYGNDGLRGVVAVPVMVGAAPIHALAPEVYLRPLLVELGATVPARALYVMESDIARLPEVVAKWAAPARPLLSAALASDKARPGKAGEKE
jgi:FMN reductase